MHASPSSNHRSSFYLIFDRELYFNLPCQMSNQNTTAPFANPDEINELQALQPLPACVLHAAHKRNTLPKWICGACKFENPYTESMVCQICSSRQPKSFTSPSVMYTQHSVSTSIDSPDPKLSESTSLSDQFKEKQKDRPIGYQSYNKYQNWHSRHGLREERRSPDQTHRQSKRQYVRLRNTSLFDFLNNFVLSGN